MLITAGKGRGRELCRHLSLGNQQPPSTASKVHCAPVKCRAVGKGKRDIMKPLLSPFPTQTAYVDIDEYKNQFNIPFTLFILF